MTTATAMATRAVPWLMVVLAGLLVMARPTLVQPAAAAGAADDRVGSIT